MLLAQVSVCSKGSLDGDEHSNEQQMPSEMWGRVGEAVLWE